MGVTTAFNNRINFRKIQVVTTAFTEIICSVYGTELNNYLLKGYSTPK